MNITRRTAAKALFASATGGLLLDRNNRALGADASKAAEETIQMQVCVIGGGSGGTGAALAAARAGVKVVLLERDSVLGGTATNGLVCVWRPVIGAKQAHKNVIAIADHCLDLHAPGIKNHDLEGPFGIPYRCLLPQGVKNLLVASRAAGFSHIAASSCRLQRTLITLGQAAGNAAALAVKHHVDPRRIDIAELQAQLQSQGMDLHE